MFALAANVIGVIGVNAEKCHTAQVTQNCVFGLNGQTGSVIEGHPVFGLVKSIRTGQVLLAFHGPIAIVFQGFADL